jgi:hypothetical protein
MPRGRGIYDTYERDALGRVKTQRLCLPGEQLRGSNEDGLEFVIPKKARDY